MAAAIPAISSIISAAAPIVGGMLARRPNQETPIQETQRNLLDEILQSVKGEGPFSDLFRANEETFQKSFVDPAKQMFNSQIAPQIQQKFIATGQQRGTPMEDALTRAGVDLDQMLNKQLLQFQQGAENRQSNALTQILGAGAGALPEQSMKSALGQSVGGFLSSDAFPESIQDILKAFKKNKSNTSNSQKSNDRDREGFVE